jgi:hypothetical protein
MMIMINVLTANTLKNMVLHYSYIIQHVCPTFRFHTTNFRLTITYFIRITP